MIGLILLPFVYSFISFVLFFFALDYYFSVNIISKSILKTKYKKDHGFPNTKNYYAMLKVFSEYYFVFISKYEYKTLEVGDAYEFSFYKGAFSSIKYKKTLLK